MKFKTPIEVQAGISDGDPTNPLGQAGYLLSSDGSQVSWINPGGLSAETAEAIVQPIKANEVLVKGDPVYIVGFNNGQNTNIVAKADSSDPTKMPAVGLADANYASQAFGTMTAFGSFNGSFDTTGGTENWVIGDIIFVKPGGGLTNTKPTSLSLIQNVAIVSRVNQNTGELEVIALGRTNDVPNLPSGRLFVGTPANTSLASDVVYVDDTNDSLIVNGTTLQTTESLSVIGSGYFSDKISIGTAASTTPINNSYTMNLLDLNSAIAFGDNSQTTQNVIVGEYGSTDTDQLWLHGKKGTIFSHDGDINEAISIAGVIDNVGKFGLGITAPTEKLDVAGVIRNVLQAAPAAIGSVISKTLSFATSPYGIVTRGYAAGVHSMQVEREALPTQTYDLALQPNGGNLGVGTIAPASKLQVEDDSPTLILNHNGSASASRCEISARKLGVVSPTPIGTINWSTGYAGDNSTWSYYNASNSAHNFLKLDQTDGFIVSLSGSEKMRVNQAGNVGIGTTNPSSGIGSTRILKVESTGNSEVNVDHSDGGASSDIGLFSFSRNGDHLAHMKATHDGATDSAFMSFHTQQTGGSFFNASSNERMRITSIGDVGIGTTSPSSKLQVNGGVQLANDTATASAGKAGTFRYRTSGNNSYVDMCMQTGSTTWTWVNIVQNNW